MFNLSKKRFKILILFSQISLIYLVFWFLLKDVKTNGIWETVFLFLLLFWFFPRLISKNQSINQQEINQKQKIFFVSMGLLVWLIFAGLVFVSGSFGFLRLNYLARIDWYLGDWGLIFVLNLFILPLMLIAQEKFFREFLFQQFKEFFSIKTVLFLQVAFFVFFEMLFFGVFDWKFIVFNSILALILSLFYYKTRSIRYSFLVHWGLILILEIYILNQVQNLKI